MKIIIDADACPVLNSAIDIALKNNINIIIVADTTHQFHFDDERIIRIVADKGSDSADFIIANKVNEGDIVITQDYALASMCLAKKGRVVNQNGMIYTDKNIDELMFRRHISKKARKFGKSGGKTKKRTSENNISFNSTFKNLINQKILE